jgi:DNA-directed RNA polymerase specialized sigma24 family protein
VTLRTFYAYEHEAPAEDTTAARDRSTGDPHEIAWGYNLADLDQIARRAVYRAYTKWGDRTDRYQAAWSAIAEHLCTAETAPDLHDLTTVGWRAVNDAARTDARHWGADTETGRLSTGYVRYWVTPGASPIEERLVDRTALWQILPTLTPRQRQAVTALAATEDYDLAAAALGVSTNTLSAYLTDGRRRFYALWHEGEAPSGMWRLDKRRWRRTERPGRITASQLDSIRARYHAGETQPGLAAEFGVARSTINRLLTGRSHPAPDPVEAT